MRVSRLAWLGMSLVVTRACTCFPEQSNDNGCDYDGGGYGGGGDQGCGGGYDGGYGGYGGGVGRGGGVGSASCAAVGGTCVSYFALCPRGATSFLADDCPSAANPKSSYVCCVPGFSDSGADSSTPADAALEATNEAGDDATVADALEEVPEDAEADASDDVHGE